MPTITLSTDLNEVGKQGTAEFLLKNLSVPDHQVAARDQRREENVHETHIAEVRKRQWAKLL